jgi:diguanylate cyclase (GGDEF)-like protein
VGDEVLREVAEVVRHEIRKTDMLFRIGGEEFAILIAPVEGNEACDIAEGLRKSVAEHPSLKRYRVTISLGVALFEESDDKASIYRRADTMMYCAKERGKNGGVSDRSRPEGECGEGSD